MLYIASARETRSLQPCRERALLPRLPACVAMFWQTILRKYNPSEKMVLYGCASSFAHEVCSFSTSAEFELEWRQVRAAKMLGIFEATVCLQK